MRERMDAAWRGHDKEPQRPAEEQGGRHRRAGQAESALRHRAGISCTILLAVADVLRCCLPLATHPVTTAKLHTLFLRGA